MLNRQESKHRWVIRITSMIFFFTARFLNTLITSAIEFNVIMITDYPQLRTLMRGRFPFALDWYIALIMIMNLLCDMVMIMIMAMLVGE